MSSLSKNIYVKGSSHADQNSIMIVQCIGRFISGDLFSILIFLLSVCTFVSFRAIFLYLELYTGMGQSGSTS